MTDRQGGAGLVVPPAAVERRSRSAVFRLTLLFAGLFTGFSLVIFLIFLLLVDRYIEQDVRQAVRDEAAELVAIPRLSDLAAAIRDRLDPLRAAPVGRYVYFLAGPSGSCPFADDPWAEERCPVGNLRSWPDIPGDAAGWTQFSLETGEGRVRILGRVEPLRSGYRLLVGRNLETAHDLQQRMVTLFAGGVAATVIIGLGIGLFLSRRILGRLDRINRLCREIGASGLDRRLPLDGPRDEFYELSASINGMLDRISELIAVLHNVTGQVAHELRTPLARLKLRIEAAGEATSEPRLQDQLQQAGDDLDDALRTFTAILDIGKAAAASNRHHRRVDLAKVAADVVTLYEPLAEDREIAVDTTLAETTVSGDADLLKRLVANLLENAVKFAPPHSTILLAVPGREPGVLLELADRGPGIPEADRARVFERFYRSEGAGQVKGHGLGLSLVRAIARSHGIAVELADNRPGLRVRLHGGSAGPA